MTNRLTIGIVGNPNCGKTTVFNDLTAARQKVGNWPGVTVDRKSGRYFYDGRMVEVVDLPGVYSLGAVPELDSLDEQIAQDFLLGGDVDVIVNVLDAANLERNLYLTAQLMEMRVPVVVALNMLDVVRGQGIKVAPEHLAEHLGCRVVPMVASRGEGIGELKRAIAEAAAQKAPPKDIVRYGSAIERALASIEEQCSDLAVKHDVDPRWLAVRLLEGDPAARGMAAGAIDGLLEKVVPALEADQGDDADLLIADGRYAFANRLAAHVVERAGEVRHTTSDAIDRIVLNRWLGLPVFLGVIYLLFMVTINVGGAFVDFFDIAARTIFVDGFGTALTAIGAPDWLRVLLADGAGGGIQVVATFIPIIGTLYLFLAVLEDTGYMARAAYLMDRYMRRIGLPGKAFVPLIVGFGCNVPAVMASRTLDQPRDRILSVMMTPFMSCGARLAVYALFAAAFFPVGGQNVVFILYIIGILVAVGTGFVLKHTLLMGESTPLAMEIPPYHLPQVTSVVIQAWGRLKSFVFGAGKLIVAVVVVLAFLNSVGTDGSFGNQNSGKSALSAVGRAIVPVFEPMGIEEQNWPATVGIFTGVFAKEAIVGTLDALYSSLARDDARSAGSGAPGPDNAAPFDLWGGLGAAVATIPANLARLRDLILDPLGISAVSSSNAAEAAQAQSVSVGTFGAMASRFDGTIGAVAYLLFILLYTPCVAAVGAIHKEVGTRWTLFSITWTTSVAYGVAVVAYQAATFARHPAMSMAWIGGVAAASVAALLVMRLSGSYRARARAMALPAE